MKTFQFIQFISASALVVALSSCGGAPAADTAPPASSSSAATASISSSSSSSSSLASSAAASSTPADTQAPTAPATIIIGSVSTTSVTLNWSQSTDNVAVTGYRVYRDSSLIATVSSSTQTLMDSSNVTAGKTYLYGIMAGDAAGNWSSLKTLSVSTPSGSSSSSTVSGAGSSSAISVASTASSSKASSTTSVASSVASSVKSSTASSSSSVASSAATDKTSPTTPSNLRKTALSATSVTIAWNAATDNVGVTGYKVYRDQVLIATLSANTLTYTDATVIVDRTYVYTVTAGDAAGNWSTAATINAQIFHSVSMGWGIPTQRVNGDALSVNEIGGYSIKYTSLLDNSVSYLDVKGGSTVTGTVDGLIGSYTFELAAYDTNGNYSSYALVGTK